MKNKTKYKIILTLMIIAFITSIILSFVPLDKACGESLDQKPGSCTIVQTSKYESTFGIKNAHIGLIIFPFLAIITFLELKRPRKYQKKVITLIMIGSSLFALYFIYIQFFVLKAICKYCMVVDFSILISMALIIVWDEK